MKRIIYPIKLACTLIMLLASCEKYVEIKTQGALVPSESINYRYLLNNTNAFEVGPQISDMASDDIQLVDGSTQQTNLINDNYMYWRNSYTWQNVIYPVGSTSTQTDNNWNAMYNTIVYSNTIINEVPAATGTDAVKNELIAEALVHRADAYLMLANTYAKPYNAATASTDLGLPLILTQNTTQSLARAPLQRVYDQILADLKLAVPSLTAQTFNTIPSKASAYAELARCNLYMNNYAAAAKYADSALAIRSTLNNLATITLINSSTYPLRRTDPEILLSKIAYGGVSAVSYAPTSFRLSDELISLLGTKDQRYNLFTVPSTTLGANYTNSGGRYFYKDYFMSEARNIGPNVPEMMLIKAEFFARNNDAASAMLWVNTLRQKRFKTADYVPLTASNTTDALRIVIEERRREFFCRMLRWWDMRRLKSETQFQRTYTRMFGGQSFTLDPQSNRYVFPIPGIQIQLSPELQPNP